MDLGQPGNIKMVKQMNKESILYRLRKQGSMSRADLAKATALSRPTVSALVEEMIGEDLICEIGEGASKAGRKPILLAYNYKLSAVIGAVFEGTVLHMALADLKGDPLCQYTTRMNESVSGERAILELEKGLHSLLFQSGYEKEKILGIGLGLPGITQKRNGTISYAPSTGWMGLPVQKELEERLELPVTLDNDVNMMTLGEYYQGAGREVSNLIYMHIGTGIGAGIMLNRQFYRGSMEAAGEIGYMMIGPVQDRSQDGYGVFENNYAIPGITERAKRLFPDLQEETSVVKQLLQKSSEGVREAEELLEEVLTHWSYGIANMVSILDPELLILNGEIVHIGEGGLRRMEALLKNWVPVVPRMEFAVLGEQSGIIGAIYSAIESFSTIRKIRS
ncbi:ROK family transcriptional regulator [Paenibacillus filicis]|uniref:ROK family transcriptional regulator n=1 Tax=Paenibacillus filicis TaxID=669464 RepID=A0ABU9DT60_9BACL